VGDDLLPFLQDNAGLYYCPVCLALRAQMPLRQFGEAWARLVTQRGVEISEGHCVGCRGVRMVARVKAGTRKSAAA
jgi:hypothetical protein